ncbi:MAG: HAMP domain-containing histidine kinase [Firmicutes bacterium]|nr:HAMP domain-containing histidine kinase [Bacillota bacterium]
MNDAKQIKKSKTGMSIKSKILAYMLLFVVIILLLIWFFQIFFFDYIYSSVVISKLTREAEMVENHLDDGLDRIVSSIGLDDGVCVTVYKLTDTNQFTSLVNVHVSSGCLLHSTTSDTLSSLYANAKASEDGVYIYRAKMTGFSFASQLGDDDLSDSSLPDSVIYTVATTSKDGTEIAIFLNCQITPDEASVQSLTTTLMIISLITIACVLVVAIIIANHVARPITDVNREAKSLANYTYDGNKVHRGYREINELNETLSHAAVELSKADMTQKELIANVSHDLRTPLTLIGGYAEMMRDIPSENKPENLQIIIDETKRLSALVSDLLEVSQFRTGRRTLAFEPFNLTEALRETINRVMHLYEPEGYIIRLEVEGDVWVNADRTRILQVLYNLIGNAVSFTGNDRTVTIRQTINDGVVRVSVIDTGEGIAKEDLPLVWDRYYKVDKVHRRGVGGTGLGLSIVREILTLHGARFGVSSELHVGSDFWFELATVPPASMPSVPDSAAPPNSDNTPARVGEDTNPDEGKET